MALNYNTYSVQTNNNSSYSNDLIIAKNVTNSYTAFFGDDEKNTVTLTNPFFYNNVSYNTIYVNSNGTIGFNTASNTTSLTPSKSLASNMAAFFLVWADTNDVISGTNSIYCKENTTLKTFTLIYERVYYNTTTNCQVEIVLFLDYSGKAVINFGSIGNRGKSSYLGFSFGSSDQSKLINTLDGYFTPLQSPVIEINNIQANYTNKQIIIQPLLLPSPTISNFTVPTKRIGDASFTITPPATNSTGAITYTSSNLAVATISVSGSQITIVGAGNSTITATQAATSNYTAGTITAQLQVKSIPTLSISPLIKTYGQTPFTITGVTTNSPGAITYTSSTSSVATISGSQITIVGAGNSTITASQAATDNYTAGTITAQLQVVKATPTLSISPLTKTYGDGQFTITGVTTNSPGEITYTSSNSGVATISDSQITIIGAGTTTITVNLASTANYNAKTITTTLVVSKATPTLSISPLIKTYGDDPFTITPPTSNSNGAITYTSSIESVATISDSQITIIGAGTTTITAIQAATDNYTEKTITTTLVVSKATPTLSISPLIKTYGDTPFLITGINTNSNGLISYESSNSAVATISDSTITIVGAGTSTITVNQEESRAPLANYTAGTITTTLVVSNATLTNPVIISNTNGLLYFMNTESTYANITNSVNNITTLKSSTKKVLFSRNNNITIKN